MAVRDIYMNTEYCPFIITVLRVRKMWLASIVGTALVLLSIQGGDAAMFRHPPVHRSIGGVKAQLVPNKGSTWVKVELVSTGPSDVLISPPGMDRWQLQAFAMSSGRPPPWTPAGVRMATFGGRPTAMPATPLLPGQIRAVSLQLKDYFVFKSPGCYVLRAKRWVGIRGRTSLACMVTNWAELALETNGKITWKTHGVVIPSTLWAAPVHSMPPSVLKTSKVPKTGPIAALVRLAQAVETGDVIAVRADVYDPGGESSFSAQIKALVACEQLRQAVAKRFGRNAAARLWLPLKPNSLFQQIKRIDLKTLHTGKNRASVRYWSLEPGIDGGQSRWRLSGYLWFRRMHGRWLVAGAPVKPDTNDKTRAEYLRKIAAALDGSHRALRAGKFSTQEQLQNYVADQLRQADLWMWRQQHRKFLMQFQRAAQRTGVPATLPSGK